MDKALKLTASQKKAAERLEFFWRIKRGGTGRLGSTEMRPIPLFIGPSGAGKTASVRDFAVRHGLQLFSISAATWIVRGAKNDDHTPDALAAWVGEHSGEGGVIFIDEINKLRRKLFDALCISANDLPGQLALLSSKQFMAHVEASTREALHSLATLAFQFEFEAASIRRIMEEPEKLAEARIVDQEDARVLWFRK